MQEISASEVPGSSTNCCVCAAASPVFQGTWILNEKGAKRFGLPPEQKIMILYGLCSKCHEAPDHIERVEQAIFSRYGIQ